MIDHGRAVTFLIALCVIGPSVSPADENPADGDKALEVTAADREHWSYHPIRKPPLPAVGNLNWSRTPIDRFVLAALEKQGWTPAAPEKPEQLLRRLHLDLIGLPPSIVEQDDFLSNPTAKRLDEVADRLLRRPGYGERWARHWLDLVRYADTNGYERDGSKPEGWRYRDYVIDALNNDKPYDRFILEQLAGDELSEVTAETVIATGFYRLGPFDDEPADPKQDLHDQRDDMIRTVSQVFLAQTLGCARCHDHKFDALSARDYYSMSAIFAPLKRPQDGRTELSRPAGSAEQIAQVEERDRRIDVLNSRIEGLRASTRTELLKSKRSGLPEIAAAAFLTKPDKRSDEQQKLITEHRVALDARTDEALPAREKAQLLRIKADILALRQQVPDLPRGYFLYEDATPPPETFILLRGRASTPGEKVQPAVPAVLAIEQPKFPQKIGSTSRRRLTLANWIASSDNPLTARVIVNRVWQYHFGEGLVRTPSDFGILGMEPTHPELLDWLAYWFVHEAGWSLKKLHRLIVRSNVYRMSTARTDEYAEADPENELLWRFPYRRLQVEAIRDSMLAASGKLNRKMSGPGVYLYIPDQILEGHADKQKIWQPFDETEASRRTIYAFVKRSLIVPMLEVLDLCDTTRSTEMRNITSVPTQALTLFNGDFVNRQSRHLTGRLLLEAGDETSDLIEMLWRLTLCRKPTDEESKQIESWLRAESARIRMESAGSDKPRTKAEADRAALNQLCRVVFNLNEFAYRN